jgi:DNA-binding LacI/PurR family transcriptional regulator
MVGISGFRLAGIPQVRADVRRGMFDLTNHLLKLGYRRMVLLTQWPLGDLAEAQCWYVKERMDGFRAAAQAAGLGENDAKVVFEDFVSDPAQPYLTGKVAMSKLLKRAPRPEVVLCSNDDWAMGALTACVEAGLHAPEDIAITGFDNSLVSEYGAVPLTTVAQPLEEMAGKAVELICKMMEGRKPAKSEQLVRVPCHLMIRRSSGTTLPAKEMA